MADFIQNWLETTLEDSLIQWDYLRDKRLDDTFGWGAIFAASLMDNPDVSGCGLLLTGPEGCGKHNAALHMMKLLSQQGYEMLFLEGTELGALGTGQAVQRLDALLDLFCRENKSLCVCLEGMESCSCRRELLNYWGRTLLNYLMFPEQFRPLFLILIDDGEQDIPALLRDRLRLCRMSLPDQNHRAAFLKRRARSIRNDVSLKVFAQATEGASYGQILDMIGNVQGLLDSREGGVDDEELRRFLAQQMPAPSPEDASWAIARLVQQLVEQLPRVLQEAAVHTGIPAEISALQANKPVANLAPQNQADFVASRRQEIENMPPKQLASELFGEETVNIMIMA